jgi:hypothetical protein
MRKASVLILLALFCVLPPALSAGCGQEEAQALAGRVLARMGGLFGGTAAAPEIVLYGTAEELRRALSAQEGIAGLYDPDCHRVHVACSEGSAPVFERVLRHEAAHAYVHQVYGPVPAWLDEGIATCLEAGSLAEGGLSAQINAERLKEFRMLLMRGRVPSLAVFLSANPGAPLPSAGYAVAWGLVFTLLHHSDPAIQSRNRRILRTLLPATASSGVDVYAIFADAVAAGPENMERWERSWRRALWSLPVGD